MHTSENTQASHSAYCYLSAVEGYPIAGRHSSFDQPPATDELLDRLPIAARAILAGESPAASTNCGFFSALKLDYVDDPLTPADVVKCWRTAVSDRPCPRLRREGHGRGARCLRRSIHGEVVIRPSPFVGVLGVLAVWLAERFNRHTKRVPTPTRD